MRSPGSRKPEIADFVAVRKCVSSDSEGVSRNPVKRVLRLERPRAASEDGPPDLAPPLEERCLPACFTVHHNNSKVTVANCGAGCKKLFGRGSIVPGRNFAVDRPWNRQPIFRGPRRWDRARPECLAGDRSCRAAHRRRRCDSRRAYGLLLDRSSRMLQSN